jgi:hypothetical protein
VSGGCTNCASKGGCEERKGGERELLAELLPALYPTGVWGEPDDAARYRGGVGTREARRLARQASELLRAPTWFRAGAEDESCDYIYVLCVGRAPGLVELCEQDRLAVADGDAIREKYLRAAVSQMARVAAIQEVSIELDLRDGAYLIREAPQPGVYDPILLERTQRLVELLAQASISYLDFGLIDRPPLGYRHGDYVERYGQEPGIVNYLFYPQPSTAVSTVLIPAR